MAAHLEAGRRLRILDVGCGSGEQIASLAAYFTAARFIGVDLSPANIEAARQSCREQGIAGRVDLIAEDYLRFAPDCAVDVIVSYSTLHLIDAPLSTLLGKLSAELAPGGWLFNVIPYDCTYNRALLLLRRALRRVRCRSSDAAVLAAARLLHGRAFSEEMLRERIVYMYEIPQHLDGAQLREMARERFGLDLVAERAEPHASPAQLKHRLSVFRRREARP